MPSENVKWKRESIIMKWTEVGFFHEDLGDWIYNDRYEIEMIQIMKKDKAVFWGEEYNLKWRNYYGENKNEEKYNWELGNCENVYLRRFGNMIYTVPNYLEAHEKHYFFTSMGFTVENMKLIYSNKEILEMEILTLKDVIYQWLFTSHYSDDFINNLKEYASALINQVYFVDDERIDENIDKNFRKIVNLKENEVKLERIDISKFETVDVYLENGTVWQAFLRKNEKLYLNTDVDVSIQIL